MKIQIFLIIFLSLTTFSYGNEIFGEYLQDIQSDAQAKNTKIHEARSDNTRYRVKHNIISGTIITNNKQSEYNSLFGITLEKGATAGPIVMDTDLGTNNVIIIENNKKY